MKRRATIKNIADSLNLSTSTVSRILNGKGEFSKETTDAVKRVAQMLDYRVNSLAVSLRKNIPRKVLGVILPQVNHYFFSSILNGIMITSHNQGFMVMVGESLDQFEKEKELINNFADHFVSGIILAPSQDKQSALNISKMDREYLPNVVIDRTFEGKLGSFVRHDDFNGAYKAVSHFIKNGRKKIGIIKGPDRCNISSARFEGYKKALKDNDIQYSKSLMRSAPITNKSDGYKFFKDLYEKEQPQAVFTITDMLASGVYEYASEKNIEIPKDLAVIGYSNSEISDLLKPKLSTVNQNGFEMGKMAYEYLMLQIEDPKIKRQMTFESELILRDSA